MARCAARCAHPAADAGANASWVLVSSLCGGFREAETLQPGTQPSRARPKIFGCPDPPQRFGLQELVQLLNSTDSPLLTCPSLRLGPAMACCTQRQVAILTWWNRPGALEMGTGKGFALRPLKRSAFWRPSVLARDRPVPVSGKNIWGKRISLEAVKEATVTREKPEVLRFIWPCSRVLSRGPARKLLAVVGCVTMACLALKLSFDSEMPSMRCFVSFHQLQETQRAVFNGHTLSFVCRRVHAAQMREPVHTYVCTVPEKAWRPLDLHRRRGHYPLHHPAGKPVVRRTGS